MYYMRLNKDGKKRGKKIRNLENNDDTESNFNVSSAQPFFNMCTVGLCWNGNDSKIVVIIV